MPAALARAVCGAARRRHGPRPRFEVPDQQVSRARCPGRRSVPPAGAAAFPGLGPDDRGAAPAGRRRPRGAGRRRLRPGPGGDAHPAGFRRCRTPPSTAASPARSCGSCRRWRRSASGATVFDGDPHARERPMGTIIDALAGARRRRQRRGRRNARRPCRSASTARGRSGAATSSSTPARPPSSSPPCCWSAHASPKACTLNTPGSTVPSLDHINMTVAVLRGVGVEVDDSTPEPLDCQPGTHPCLRPTHRAGPVQRRARSWPRPWRPAAPYGFRTGRNTPPRWATCGGAS